MKNFAYLASMLLLLLASCSDDFFPEAAEPSLPDGSPVEILVGAEFPEMAFDPLTRAFSEDLSDAELEALNVNILVFDAAGVMLQAIPPSDIDFDHIDADERRVFFRVRNIYSSSQPRRLHFVLTPAPEISKLPGGDYVASMASENTVMPALLTENETDAYWGLCELGEITAESRLDVSLIRNFCKLSVNCSVKDSRTFKFLGYTVANRPGKGAVVPYIPKNHSFAAFLSPKGDMYSYEDILSQGFLGINPTGVEASMTYTSVDEVQRSLADSERRLAAGEADTPYYLYERSQSVIGINSGDVALTYVIVVGEYRGTRYFYKIDIGSEQNGLFHFYDLIRNFRYTLTITNVAGPGALSLQDAMNGAAHNNISTSLATRDLYSISYGNEKIEVNSTRVIFTEKTVNYELLFRYTRPDAGTIVMFDPKYLKLYSLADSQNREYDMSGLTGGRTKEIDIAGEVVESAVLSEAGNKWYKLTITTKNLPADARRLEQGLRIYYADGDIRLGRSVTLMLRRPWKFTSASAISFPDSRVNSSFSVSFTLPPGISSSLFPLTLTFESDKQNMYAKYGSALHVSSGPSGFPGGSSDNVMLYEWRIEWEMYNEAVKSKNGVFTAEFLTNTTSSSDMDYSTASIDAADLQGRTDNDGSSDFSIRIANKGPKYLEPAYINVTRK